MESAEASACCDDAAVLKKLSQKWGYEWKSCGVSFVNYHVTDSPPPALGVDICKLKE